ncbi:MAG: hypothetical protein ABIT37_15990 [Luteolibacter sp.]
MKSFLSAAISAIGAISSLPAADETLTFATDPGQTLERTCFQTAAPWGEKYNLRSDVAIVYGIDPKLPERIGTWRDKGYRIHVMTGVSWGNYQDYLYGRFDGISHEDEAQTVSDGRKSSHGGDVYYMCPGINYGKFLCVGVQRALDAGAEAIHLEEPEFWVNSGYSEGFKREWHAYYNEPWQAPHSSVNAQWRASKLKYFLFRRALQQVFDHVQEFNKRTGKHVRCYVPTHSLLNYAHWNIVSPESSLARLNGCDGYIAQVWTGTSRTPNVYQGKLKERTFETAFLEYSSMYHMIQGTGRSVWYLNDPIEDNPNHDWNDYQHNWESTLTASLLNPDVWKFEVAPWPERIVNGRYPKSAKPENRISIPPGYATELQTVMNALNDMKQDRVSWDCGTSGIGLLVSDSLMFQRGDPKPSDPHLSHVYGLAMPLLKHGIPVAPMQLENVTVPHYLDSSKVLLLTYQGMKPLTAEVHARIADWVKQGGSLIFCDDDSDPFNTVKEWWNSDGMRFSTPREHLFAQLGFPQANPDEPSWSFGKGHVIWLRKNPATLAATAEGAEQVVATVRQAAEAANLKWRETASLVLRRGPYVIAAGLDESIAGDPKVIKGRFVNLFDPELRVMNDVRIDAGSRCFLRDLDAASLPKQQLVAAACRALPIKSTEDTLSFLVEGAAETSAVMLLKIPVKPKSVTLDGQPLEGTVYSKREGLLWLRFPNQATPRPLDLRF